MPGILRTKRYCTEMKGIQLEDYDLSVKVKKDSAGQIISGVIIGDTLHQNQALILQMHKGELHEDPSVGVGISDMLLDHDSESWKREIREQMELDGQQVDSVTFENNEIIIDSAY